MKRRHTSIDLTWSNLHFHTQAHASGLQTGDQASRCKYSWNILICSQLTTSNLKRCPFSGIRLSIRGLQCTCFFLPKYCPGGTKIIQYFTWRVFKSIFSRRIVQSALQVGSYEGNHGNQTATKCCKCHFDRHPWLLTYVELYKLNKTWYQRHKIADPLLAKRARWENHLPIVMLNESMNMAVGSDSVFASCFISCFCICLSSSQ